MTGITVVIAAWDDYVTRYLPEAIDSILAQDEPRAVVVVDNASRVPVEPRPGVEVVRTERRLTTGAARNVGLSATKTEAVMFWDADDVMLPGVLGRLRTRLDADPSVVAVCAGILESPGVPHRWPRPIGRRLARRPLALALAQTLTSHFPTTGAVLMRTAAVEDASGFADAEGGDDWVLGASLAFRGHVAFDPVPGRLYRQHPDSVSAAWEFVPHQVEHMRLVRERVRSDPAIPRPLRLLAPLLAPLQLGVALVVGPLARLAAGARRG